MVQNLDEMSIRDILNYINAADKTVPLIVEKALPQIEIVIQSVVKTIRNGGKIIYMGSGTSGRLGILDASECPPTFGVSPDLFTGIIAGGDQAIRRAVEDAEDDIRAGYLEIENIATSKDMLIGIAASGRTPYVIGGIKKAKEKNIPTAGIVCALNSKISSIVDFPVELLVGEEVIRGSTRLKAGTAQKLALNMISTTSMIKLGKVYKNYMVDVQASNEKLRKRTIEIICELAHVNEQKAKQALQQSNGNLKVAVLVCSYRINAVEAKAVLRNVEDHLGKAIQMMDAKHTINKVIE